MQNSPHPPTIPNLHPSHIAVEKQTHIKSAQPFEEPEGTTNQHPHFSIPPLLHCKSSVLATPITFPKPPGGDVSDVMQRDTRQPSSFFAPRPKLTFCCAATIVVFFYTNLLIIVHYLLFDLTELAKSGDFVFAYLSVACCCADKAIHV